MSDETNDPNSNETAEAIGLRMIARRLAERRKAAKGADDVAGQKRRRVRKPNRTVAARKSGQIDLRAILSEPLSALKAGRRIKIDPIEAAVRAQVSKALNDKNLAAIKEVIDLALKHDLIQSPPEQRAGGVLVIPKSLPEEIQQAIFSHDAQLPVSLILEFLELHYADTRQ